MEASNLKCVNSVLNIIGVNSLRLEGIHINKDNKANKINKNSILVRFIKIFKIPYETRIH